MKRRAGLIAAERAAAGVEIVRNLPVDDVQVVEALPANGTRRSRPSERGGAEPAGAGVHLGRVLARAVGIEQRRQLPRPRGRRRRRRAVSRGAGVTVAVIDTGVDATHADLQGQLVPGRDLVLDTVPDHDPRDVHGHETHVTGTIAAAEALRTLLRNVPRNGRLTLEASDRARRIVVLRADVVFASGDVVRLERRVVSPEVAIMPLRACATTCSDADVAEALNWAGDHGGAHRQRQEQHPAATARAPPRGE